MVLLQTSDKEKTLKQPEERTHVTWIRHIYNTSKNDRLLVRNNEAIRQWRNIFRILIKGTVQHKKQIIQQRKKMSTYNSIPSKNIFQKK